MKVLFRFRGEDANTDFLSLAVHSWQRFALFFRKASLPEVKSQLHTLRFSVKEQRAIERTLELWHQPQDFFRMSLGRRLLQMDEEGLPWALTILKAQNLFRAEIESLEAAWLEWQQQLPKPFLSGTDVKNLQGKAIGTCLAQAFELQLERKLKTREEALTWLQTYQQKA
jgi:tRNA nucleotidyltransferase (CCA-adding enzyme)